MNYTTGQRFKAKIQGTPVEGKILVIDGFIHLCNNTKYLKRTYDTLGYDGSWFFTTNEGYPMEFNRVTDLILLPDTSFDKDNWVVDIIAEKDHPRMGEFKEWINARNREMKMCDFEFLFTFYGIINGKAGVLNGSKKSSSPTITLDTFFTHFCKENDEPQKGDLVEVSNDKKNWMNLIKWKCTGGQTELGNHIVEYRDTLSQFKHIRLAKSPEQVRHEEAEKKAREFIESKGLLPNASPIYTLTEYIKTEK